MAAQLAVSQEVSIDKQAQSVEEIRYLRFLGYHGGGYQDHGVL
jgi:hypothetical protein